MFLSFARAVRVRVRVRGYCREHFRRSPSFVASALSHSPLRLPISISLDWTGLRQTDRGLNELYPCLAVVAGGAVRRLAGPKMRNRRPLLKSRYSPHSRTESVRHFRPSCRRCMPSVFAHSSCFVIEGGFAEEEIRRPHSEEATSNFEGMLLNLP